MSAPTCDYCRDAASWEVRPEDTAEVRGSTGWACNQDRHLSRVLEAFAWKGPRGMKFTVTDIRPTDEESTP